MLQSSATQSAVRRIFVLVLLMAAGWCFVSFYWPDAQSVAKDPQLADYYKFYTSGQRQLAGKSIYWRVPARARAGDPCHPSTSLDVTLRDQSLPADLRLEGEDRCLGPNLSTPTFAWLLLPLSWLNFADSWWMWWLSSGPLAMMASAYLLTKQRSHESSQVFTQTVLAACAMTIFFPFIANASLGQVGVLILLLMLSTQRLLERDRPILGSLALGALIAMKPFLALFIPALWLGGHRKLAHHTGFAAISMLGLGGLALGWPVYIDYAHVLRDITWAGTNWNASWLSMVERSMSGHAASHWPQGSNTAKFLGLAISALTCAVALALSSRARSAPSHRSLASLFALIPPACLLATPLGWVYYFPLLLPCWLYVWRASAHNTNRRAYRAGLLLSIGLCAIPTYIKPSPRPEWPTAWMSTDSIYFVSLLLTYILACILIMELTNKKGAMRAPGLETLKISGPNP